MVEARSGSAQPGGGLARWLFWPLLFFTLALSILFQVVIGPPLKTPAAPLGIVSYELVGTPAGAQAILDSWNPLARAYAGFSLGIDYVYMPCYALTIGLACGWAARRLRAKSKALSILGLVFGWGVGVAALCDATENVALAKMLLGGVAAPWPAIARWCATAKFALIIAGLLYALAGLIFWLTTRRAQPAAA